MQDQSVLMEERRAALAWYIERRLKQGFQVESRCDTSAIMFKPAGFPAFLRKEQTLYVDVDGQGRIYVRSSHY